MNNHSYHRINYVIQEKVNATQPYNSYYTYNTTPINGHHNEVNYGIEKENMQAHYLQDPLNKVIDNSRVFNHYNCNLHLNSTAANNVEQKSAKAAKEIDNIFNLKDTSSMIRESIFDEIRHNMNEEYINSNTTTPLFDRINDRDTKGKTMAVLLRDTVVLRMQFMEVQ